MKCQEDRQYFFVLTKNAIDKLRYLCYYVKNSERIKPENKFDSESFRWVRGNEESQETTFGSCRIEFTVGADGSARYSLMRSGNSR